MSDAELLAWLEYELVILTRVVHANLETQCGGYVVQAARDLLGQRRERVERLTGRSR